MSCDVRRALPAAVFYLAVVTLLYGLQVQIVRGDAASCLARVAPYVNELDQLLDTEKNWITPYLKLHDKYSQFADCDTDALLEEVSRSRFFRRITYNPRSKTYFVRFSSNDVEVGFAYDARERKSDKPNAGWVNK